MKVAYLGPKGTFTYQAAVSAFKHLESIELVPMSNFSDITGCVLQGFTRYAVLPFENSTNGHVVATLDILRDSPDIHVVRELYLDVHQCLVSSTGTKSIKKIYSHSQAFGQCELFLADELPHVERISVNSTGYAAQLAAMDPESAAIASASSIDDIPSLKVVHNSIEDKKNNTTRFIVLALQGVEPQRSLLPSKSMIKIILGPNSGALGLTMKAFSDAQVNLTSMFSRPNVEEAQRWSYVFFAEFGGHETDSHVQQALRCISETTPGTRIEFLGSFPDERCAQ